LGHVILFVCDLAASVGFYRDVVGLEHRFTDAGYAEFGTGPTRFALYDLTWLTG
jgi:lactoylglutathione lyase